METPFNLTIVGMTNCGKTYYLLEMLEKDFFRHFERMYLICSTYEWNKTYQNWKYNQDPDFVVIQCSQDEVERYLSLVWSVAKGTNSLIILDDCAGGKMLNKHESELVRLAMTGRHSGNSTVVISQQCTSVAKAFRDQTSKFVIFLPKDDEDFDVIFKKNLRKEDKNTLKISRRPWKIQNTQDSRLKEPFHANTNSLFRRYK